MAAWQYIGYKKTFNGWDHIWYYYWSNGEDVAIASGIDPDKISNIPDSSCEYSYGAIEEYNGDIVALINDWDITRDSV